MGKKHASTKVSSLSKEFIYKENLDHVYMRPEVNSNRFEISNRFEKLFRVHGNFTTANLEFLNPFPKLFPLHGDFPTTTFQLR